MLIFPAIDLYEGQAVRLYKGDYQKKTVYSDTPVDVARDFRSCGASHIHLVDLEGAKSGTTPNLPLICRIKQETGLFCEVGGGVRSMEVVRRYMDSGIDRVILGTAAVTDPAFLREAVAAYGERIAVGIDIKDGFVAIRGWTETSALDALTFCGEMEQLGVKTLICTDISRDGAMVGTNRELYRTLSRRFPLQIIASGGVSSLEDVKALRAMELYGAIIGRAYYTGAIALREAIEVAT
jgi:phosphoribosylformimino-5-aminoimidazole carboxamide ribotide isomerase